MFTGIIESLGVVKKINRDQGNVHFTIESPISDELHVDQSLSHNGVCLTVVAVGDGTHTVTAIQETLQKSNMGELKPGDLVNLERAMQLGDRLDGHIVQGHVDSTARCTGVSETDGSWFYTFEYPDSDQNITIEKGSISVNGVSLTVVGSKKGEFGVAIIPYTYENTNFKQLKPGMSANLEFDVIGKYVERLMRGSS